MPERLNPKSPLTRPAATLTLLGSLLAAATSAAPKPAPRPAKKKLASQKLPPERSQVPALPAGNSAQPAAPKTAPPSLTLRTSAEFDPRLDLKVDSLAVAKAGARWDELDRAVQSWSSAGIPTYRFLPINSDPGSFFTSGMADGIPHLNDVDLDASGSPVSWRDRPVLLPTASWIAYLKDNIRHAIDAGAAGIWAEDPGLPALGGYSPTFKSAWTELFQAPWQAPHTSPTTFFRGSRLRADLSLRLVNELQKHVRDYGQLKTRETRLLLTLDSPLNYAREGMVFPHSAAAALPIGGIAAQIRPDFSPHALEGKLEPRPFEMAWLAGSYFANLMEGRPDQSLYYLMDPGGEATSAAAAARAYRAHLATALLFPQARGYETAAYPERTYTAGMDADTSTMGLSHSLTLHTALAGVVKDLEVGQALDWGASTRGIGVLTFDTLQWQRGGPQQSSLRSLDGLTLPLLQRGIPVELVPGERVTEKGYLSRFRVLLLSYDFQKPLGPEVHQELAAWVKAGGVLILVGGEDAYNDAGEWWNRNGFPSPTEHLLRACGAGVEVAFRATQRPGDRYRPALRPESEMRGSVRLSLADAASGKKPVYVRFTDANPTTAGGLWLGRVRLVEGDRVRADFTAGSVAERAFLTEEIGSQRREGGRTVEQDGSFVYRFSRLGPTATLELELGGQSQVSLSTGEDPSVLLEPVRPELPTIRAASGYSLVAYPLAGAEPLYRVARAGETAPSPAWSATCERGTVLFCGLPAAALADSSSGAALLREYVRLACGKAGLNYQEGPLVVRRGPYVVAHALGRSMQLPGQYLDLFKPDLPLLENPSLPYQEPVLLKAVQLGGKAPALLHATHRARLLEANTRTTRFIVDGPTGTWGEMRLSTAGYTLAGAQGSDTSGRSVQVEARIEGPTVHVRYPQLAGGINLSLKWAKPEARLTK